MGRGKSPKTQCLLCLGCMIVTRGVKNVSKRSSIKSMNDEMDKSDQSMDCTKFQVVDDGKLVKTCECVNKKYGCQWCGFLFYYNTDHKKRCNYQHVKCYCGETMFKALLIEHLLKKCKLTEVDYREPQEYSIDCTKCPRSHFGCKWFGTIKRFNEVHSNQCDFQDIECYCKVNVQKRYLVKHLHDDCTLRLCMPADSIDKLRKNNYNEIKINFLR